MHRRALLKTLGLAVAAAATLPSHAYALTGVATPAATSAPGELASAVATDADLEALHPQEARWYRRRFFRRRRFYRRRFFHPHFRRRRFFRRYRRFY